MCCSQTDKLTLSTVLVKLLLIFTYRPTQVTPGHACTGLLLCILLKSIELAVFWRCVWLHCSTLLSRACHWTMVACLYKHRNSLNVGLFILLHWWMWLFKLNTKHFCCLASSHFYEWIYGWYIVLTLCKRRKEKFSMILYIVWHTHTQAFYFFFKVTTLYKRNTSVHTVPTLPRLSHIQKTWNLFSRVEWEPGRKAHNSSCGTLVVLWKRMKVTLFLTFFTFFF